VNNLPNLFLKHLTYSWTLGLGLVVSFFLVEQLYDFMNRFEGKDYVLLLVFVILSLSISLVLGNVLRRKLNFFGRLSAQDIKTLSEPTSRSFFRGWFVVSVPIFLGVLIYGYLVSDDRSQPEFLYYGLTLLVASTIPFVLLLIFHALIWVVKGDDFDRQD
jgi:hypothetical protein